MNKKRDFKISHFCIWGEELFQIKMKFRENNRLCVIKLCVIHDQLFQFVFFKKLVDFSRFGLGSVLICFTVSLRTWNILLWLSPVFWKTHLLSYLNRLIIIYDYCKSILTVCGKFNWHAKTERIGKGKMPLSKTKTASEKIVL